MIKQRFWQYFVAGLFASSLQLSVQAQLKNPEVSLGNLREKLSSEWSQAVLGRSLASETEINAIEFSPNGELLASIGASQITIWNVSNGKVQRVLPGHFASELGLEMAPTAIAFSPDSRFVATSTWSQGLLNPDQSIMVREVESGSEVLSLKDVDGCRQILFDASGEKIFGSCGVGVTAWSFPDGEKLFSFATKNPVEAIALSPDGKVMAAVDANITGQSEEAKNNQIQLWQLGGSSPKLLNTLDGHANEIVQLKFTPDSRKLVSSSYDGKINVWRWRQGTSDRQTNNLHSDNGVFSLSPNGQLIAGNFHSSTMTSLVTGLPIQDNIKRPHNSIIAFSPQDNLLARVEKTAESNSSAINLWEASSFPQKNLTTQKKDYQPLPIEDYWSNQPKPDVPVIAEAKPAAVGKDIQAIALAGLGFGENINLEAEAEAKHDRLEVQQNFRNDNLAQVTITQTKTSDDSVEGYRYLVEFAPYGEAATEKWQVVWAGEQFRCWEGRGHQDWSTDLCH